jgi:arabinose-5-phosphate isomerase
MNSAAGQSVSRQEQDAFARQVLRVEAEAVANLPIDDAFHEVVDLILANTGHGDRPGEGRGSVVVCGLGKSGLIGQKISATFASTGTPSHFLHPTEALHGDLGRIRREDVVILLSQSGKTEEVLTLATILRQDQVPTVAMTSTRDSDLGRVATKTLTLGKIVEACPHNLAPTASATATLALGDALALCVSQRRGFGADDFKRVHPGGTIGRSLMPVSEAMRFRIGKNLNSIGPNATIRQAYDLTNMFVQATGLRRAGALLIADGEGTLVGIFTDGDLRRLVFSPTEADPMSLRIGSVMTKNPKRVRDTDTLHDVVQLVREYRIDEVPVVNADNKVVGLIDVQDLISWKVIEG